MLRRQILVIAGVAAFAVVVAAQPADAAQTPQVPQTAQAPTIPKAAQDPAQDLPTPCPDPAKLPPAGSPPLYRCLQFRFHPDNEAVIDQDTYLYYVKSRPSVASQDKWTPYDEAAIIADFDHLWKTGFLDNLWIETIDEPYANGVIGKHVIFHMEERARIKIVDYIGSKKVEPQKIEEKLREKGIEIRLDSLVDESLIRRVQGVIRDMYAEKGYHAAVVEPTKAPVAGGPKLIHLSFNITEGPSYQIREIVFDGNKNISDGTLVGQMKDNKPRSWLSFITDAGAYQEAKFADDAQKVTDYYLEQGYVLAKVGNPQIETLDDSADGKTRWIRLRIPVDEGERFKVGKFEIADNKAVKTEALRPLFKLKEGEYFDASKLRKAFEKAQAIYGTYGFWEFVPVPEFSYPGRDPVTHKPIGTDPAPPIVDVTIRMQEGKQYFVNRVIFSGNTTTHDNVIRREIRVFEGGVFNTEALKYSIRRLNQLGYFKPLERSEDIQVAAAPGLENHVDVKLKFTEQNRNQVSFGAGVSQYDGFFGQLGFQTSNFLGRGETVGISLQKGSQAKNYQVSFSEPYLFDRPITAGVDLFSRQFIYPAQFTQDSTGGNVLAGLPVADFLRFYMGYSYERVTVPRESIAPTYLLPSTLEASPYLRDELLLNQGGRRTVSKVSPSLVYNTVNEPIFPTSGKQLTAAFDVAGVGGDTYYWLTRLETIFYHRLTNRTSLGLRAQGQYIRPYGSTTTLPIFEKFFLGGEYSVRGFDLRAIGPRDPASGIVLGGNKTLLFNAEYSVNVGGPVRVIAFYDAGQVRDIGQRFAWQEPITQTVTPLTLGEPAPVVTLTDGKLPTTVVVGHSSAFKTSTGLEVRFFMPVLNVPFRLIMAYNPQRVGVLTNTLLFQKAFQIRFAVGTTF